MLKYTLLPWFINIPFGRPRNLAPRGIAGKEALEATG